LKFLFTGLPNGVIQSCGLAFLDSCDEMKILGEVGGSDIVAGVMKSRVMAKE
jgi:hypothetical protein